MRYKFILYEKKNQVAYITINRPELLNALHPPASVEMLDAFTDFRNDQNMRVAILSGAGDKAFCAGNDLKYHADHVRPGEAYPESDVIPLGGITSGFTCWKPIIAAVQGFALGGGLELALACDIIIASDNARLGLPEPRVGVVAGAGAAHFLPRAIPRKIAMGILLTGNQFGATEALNWGLVNDVVGSNSLMTTAEQWASYIKECAPLAIRATKQMAILGLDRPLIQAMSDTYPEYQNAKLSEDYIEGPRAFAQKIKYEWLGR